jgi:putative endonuclease
VTRARQALGRAGEDLAAAWYEANGYTLVARNWRCRDGEIDLVARRGRVLVVCEVKTRSSVAFGAPAEAVTPAKQARLRSLALSFLREQRVRGAQLRFDVAAVLGRSVEVIEGAF